MIDFHTHILPGIDDGSSGIPESVTLLREERKQGIEAVVMTPHFYANEQSPQRFLEKRNAAWEELAPYLWPELPEVYLGAEVQYFEGICSVDSIVDLRIAGSDLLLVEMPFHKWSDRVIHDILELNSRGDIQVVMAHIERYMSMQDDIGLWNELRSAGIMMQCNVSFFTNRKTARQAVKMLKNGEIHFLGSDCHNKTTRPPHWNLLSDKVWQMAKQNCSSDIFRRIEPAQR